jgi:hypothetical protein
MATTHEDRLREAAADGADRYSPPPIVTESLAAACLAGAEALRLLREYQETTALVRALNEDGGGSSPEVFGAACDRCDAAKAALLATEVTR